MASTIFRNARLIDSINDQPRDGVSIVVEGGRIGAVSEEVRSPLQETPPLSISKGKRSCRVSSIPTSTQP